MSWTIYMEPEAQKDYQKLAGSRRQLVLKAIKRVGINPISIYEGGYGKPLGKQHGMDLTGCYKIKLRDAGIRVIYRLVRTKTKMSVVVIGMRADDAVYREAWNRIQKHPLSEAEEPEETGD